MLIVDLDGFKQVNDSLGHEPATSSDGVAERFEEVVRPGDTIARLGGDEFALLLDGADERQSQGIGGRLLGRPPSRSSRRPQAGARRQHRRRRPPRRARRGKELMRQADVAMYAAKEAGRGRDEVFRHEMARELGELLGLEHEMRLGIQRGEFNVHYSRRST